MEEEMMAWQWHQLDHTQIICRQKNIRQHLITYFCTHLMLFVMPNQQHRRYEGNHVYLEKHDKISR